MAKRKEQTESATDLDLDSLSSKELIALASKLATLASEQKQRERSSKDSPSRRGSPRDPLVRQLAALALHDLHAPVKEGGKGLSLREIARMHDVSPERVRQLYIELVADADDEGESESG